jgi:O-antigen/teichoic acid export membrane protein
MLPTRIVLLLCAVATSALLARELGPSGRGTVAVAYSFTLLLVQIGTLGFTAANPFYVARTPEARERLVGNSILVALVGGMALAAVGVGVGLLFPTVVAGVEPGDLVIASVGIPAALLAQFLQSILLGEARPVAYNASELVISALTLVAVAIAAATTQIGVTEALVLLGGSRLCAAAVFAKLTVRSPKLDPRLIRTMLTYGARVYVATMLAFLVVRLDVMLVNGYLGAEDAGVYAVAVALGDVLYIVPTVVAVNLFAHVARGADDAASAAAFRAVAVIYLVLVALSAAFAGPVISLLFGDDFEPAAAVYRWLAPGIFCLGMLNILSQHFAGRGFPLQAMLVWVWGFALNLAINLTLLSTGGVKVAAIASTAAYGLLLLLHMRMFARDVGGYDAMRPRLDETVRLLARIRTAVSLQRLS